MRATRIPRDQRIMLLPMDRKKHFLPGLLVWRTLHLKRWTGELPEGGVITASGGMACGCCQHYSVFRWRILLHRHPGGRPVPEDMKAALRGEAPVPEWFRGERP
jgi:hypothetical protein